MRFTWPKILGIWGLVLILLFGMGSAGMGSAVSAEEKYYAKQGTYIGLTLPYNAINGNFDGESFLSRQSEIILVPKVESSFGWGILLGGRRQKWAGELSYLRSTHDVTWLGAKGEATYNIVSLDFKRYFLVDGPVQPYFLLGWIPYASFVVKDGSASSSGDVGDATFTALLTGLNLGGGLAFYLHPRVSLNGGIIYRLILFGDAEGVEGVTAPIEDPLSGSGLNLNVGIAFTF